MERIGIGFSSLKGIRVKYLTLLIIFTTSAPLARAFDLFSEPNDVKKASDSAVADAKADLDKIRDKEDEADQKLAHAGQVAADSGSTLDAVIGAGVELTSVQADLDKAKDRLGDAKDRLADSRKKIDGMKCDIFEPIANMLCNSQVKDAIKAADSDLDSAEKALSRKGDDIHDELKSVGAAIAAVEAAKAHKEQMASDAAAATAAAAASAASVASESSSSSSYSWETNASETSSSTSSNDDINGVIQPR